MKRLDQKEQFTFMREKIKEKPINRKKLIKRTLMTVAMAIVFGLVACVTFLVLEPVISNKLYPEEIPKVKLPETTEEILPNEMLTDEETKEELVKQVVEQVEGPSRQSINDSLNVDSYQILYDRLYERAQEANSFLVTVTGVASTMDWFQNEVENENTTSGVILADNGVEILVLAYANDLPDAQSYRITFCGEKPVEAQLKEKSSKTGLGIFSVRKEILGEACLAKIKPAKLGNSNSIQLIGRPIIAIGRPYGQDGSIAYGIVTSTGKTIQAPDDLYKVITTDMYASEKSSGFLLSITGELIGVITDEANGIEKNQVICALGVSDILSLVEKLSNAEPRAYIGIIGMDVTPLAYEELNVPYGVYVTEAISKSPAMNAGIASGNVITKVDGKPVASMQDYKKIIDSLKPEQEVKISLMRFVEDQYKEDEITITTEKAK